MAVGDYLLNARTLRAGGPVQAQGYAPEVMKLANTLSRQRYSAGLGAPQQPKPGLLQKVFDVIQRPLYSSANTVNYLQQGKNPFMGAVRGATGQDKTTYDKVLADAGMSGGWQRSLAGLGLDIGLDPTTYISGGVLKGTTEGVATKAGLDAVEAATTKSPRLVDRLTKRIYEAGRTISTTESAASKAKRATALEALQTNTRQAALEAIERGENLKSFAQRLPETEKMIPRKSFEMEEKLTRAEARQQAADQIAGDLQSIFHEARDKALAEGRGKVVLKFMGKPIPGLESEGLYAIGSKVAKTTNGVPVLNALSKNFRPTATYTQGTNDLLREAIGWSLFDGDNTLAHLRNTFGEGVHTNVAKEAWGGLSAGQRDTISHAIENGHDLSDQLVPGTGRTLEEYKQHIMKIRDDNFAAEAEMGIRKADKYMPDHVPHIYEGGTAEEQAAFRKGRQGAFKVWRTARDKAIEAGKDIPDARPFMEPWNLEHAAEAGLKPKTDIGDIMANRIIESYNKQGTARFFQAVGKEFGTYLGEGLPRSLKGSIDTFGKNANLVKIKNPYFAGLKNPTNDMWFDSEIADVLTHHLNTLSDKGSQNELLKYFDKVQNTWKFGMTALNPGHHIRNFAGDTFLNWMDGVKNPYQYVKAQKVLKYWESNPNMVITKIGERKVTAREMMQNLFAQYGGKAGFFRNETAIAGKISGRHPVESIRQMAELREDWTRLAHFIDVMEKEGTKVKSIEDLRGVARQAGRRVRKFNIDYGDLTPFEQKWMKRVVPFYTWMRKNIPLQLETLALDPGKINVIPKGLRALQSIVGAQPDEQNVFGLTIVPQWLREMGGVRIAGEGMGRNQVYWNPQTLLPFMDVPQYFSGGPSEITRGFLNTASPFIKTPIEHATGKQLYTGAPLQGPFDYAQQAILPPTVKSIHQILTQRGSSGLAGLGSAGDWGKLFGPSLTDVGPQQQLGELRRQQDLVQSILKKKKPKQPRSWEK